MNTKNLLTVIFVLLGTMAMAQSQKFGNVRNFELRNSGNILENDNIVGYYVFYKQDKVDKKTESFKIVLMDNNLTTMKEFNVVRPEKSSLIEMVFNGSTFMMVYFVKDDLEMVTYDKQGKKLGSKKFEDIPNWEKMRLAQIQEGGAANKTVYALSDSSFIRQSMIKDGKYGFEVEAYSNTMKSLWKYKSPADGDMHEAIDILSTSKNYIGALVARKKSAMTKSMEQAYLVLDAVTGKKIMEKPLKEKDSELSILNVFIDEERKRSILLGEYYAPGDEIMNSKSQGLYSMIMDLSGAKSNFKKYSWSRDLAKVMEDVTDEKKSKTPPAIYFHKVYRSKTGKAIAIGEQYRKQASAMGIAGAVLSGGRGGGSTAEMKVMDMVVMEFDSSNNITNAFNVSKKTTRVALPQGAEFMSGAMVANYIKSQGGFDYNFTTVDTKKDRLTTVYTDYNKSADDSKDSEKSDAMFGAITYEGGKSKTERIPINTNASYLWVAPAKPGYMMVGEYFKKRKEISVRLEKISY